MKSTSNSFAIHGFSLLELLVVTAITAIIAGLIFPMLGRAMRMSHATTDISNMRQLYAAVVMYESDNNDLAPNTLDSVFDYVRVKGVYQSELDPRQPDRKLRDWTSAPCGPRGYWPRVSYRISFPYLRTFFPENRHSGDRFDYYFHRQNPKIGMIADPWVGDIVSWDYSIVAGEDIASTHGPQMTGGVYRIRMDGSLKKLGTRRSEGFLCASTMDLFFNGNR